MDKARLIREVRSVVDLDSGLLDCKVLASKLARSQGIVEAELVNYQIAERHSGPDVFCLLRQPLESARKAASWIPK